MIRALLFDFYGVLYPDTFWTMSSEFLGERLPEKRAELHGLIRQLDLGHLTSDELWQEFAQLAEVDESTLQQRLAQFDGVDKALLDVIEAAKPNYKIGVISNAGKDALTQHFTDKPIEQYFDAVTLSSELGVIKPDPAIYKHAARALGVEPEECLFADDLQKNVDGAQAVGMQALLYTNLPRYIADAKRWGVQLEV